MSLVTATAVQVSPAVQARAFIVLGALATSDVDDDFFYQMLVALKTALSQFNDADTLAVVSMLPLADILAIQAHHITLDEDDPKTILFLYTHHFDGKEALHGVESK